MKVVLFEFQHKPSMVEIAFELAHRHLAHGDSVTYRFLGYDVTPTYLSPIAGSLLIGPWLPERRGARLLADSSFTFVPRARLERMPLPSGVPTSLAELKLLSHEEFDVGMAVASSLISQSRNSAYDPAGEPRTVGRIIQDAIAVFEHVKNVLDKERPDLVYVFNGRLAYDRAVLRACQVLEVPYLIYEMGSSPQTFFLRPYSTHDRERIQQEIRATWQKVRTSEEAAAQASTWFEERRAGRPRDWSSFTSMQKPSRLPGGLEGKRIVAYFSSSDDEFAAIGDAYRWEGWANQLDAVRNLIDVVSEFDDTRLVVRLHPHLVHKHPSERTRWMDLEGSSPNLILIAPESDVDTYALLDAADVVVTGGSTMGVEAAYWGRPSVLLGPSDYDELGMVHKANDVPTLQRLLSEPKLPIPREPALAYGYHRATFGERHVVYRPEGLHRGTFLGTDLRTPLWRIVAGVRVRLIDGFRSFRARFA